MEIWNLLARAAWSCVEAFTDNSSRLCADELSSGGPMNVNISNWFTHFKFHATCSIES